MKFLHNQKTMMYIGIALVGLTAGLIIWLNVFGKPNAEVQATPIVAEKSGDRDIYVCAVAPEYIGEALPRTTAYWGERGCVYGKVHLNAPCEKQCTQVQANGDVAEFPCHDRAFTISVFSADPDRAGHLAETWWKKNADGVLEYATVLMPIFFDPKLVVTAEGEIIEADSFPAEVKELVLTHEFGHAEGLDDEKTQIAGPLVASKSGQIMNQSVYGLGWGDAGVPKIVCE